MKQTSISKKSAAPETPDDERRFTQAHLARAEYRVGGKKVTKAEWQLAARAQLDSFGKKRISIMLDAVVIEYFKTMAGERGYQTLINDALRKTMAGEQMVNQVRHVVREELAAYKIK